MAISTTTAFVDAGGTVSSTALALTAAPFSLTAAQIDRASRARVTNDSAQPVRYRYTGTAPTAANGHYLPVSTTVVIEGNDNIRNLQVIRATGSDATVWVTLEE